MGCNKTKICDYCIRKIRSKYIKCCECNIKLCVKCFCYGVEEGKHLKSHRYIIKDRITKYNNVLRINSKWSYDEEEKFLEALEQFKTGNWCDISLNVKTKTSEQCRNHFIGNYLENPFTKQLSSEIRHHLRCKLVRKSSIFDHTEGVSQRDLFVTYPPVLIKPEEEKWIGLNSNRNEYIREYNNDAEELISGIQPNTRDLLSQSLYESLVSIYRTNLCERQRYKHVIREHNIIPHVIATIYSRPCRDLAYFQRQLAKRLQLSSQNESIFSIPSTNPRSRSLFSLSTTSSRGNEAQDHDQQFTHEHSSWNYNASHLTDELKPFLKFLSAGNMRQLFEGLKLEHHLKNEINALKYCFSKGIHNHKDYKLMTNTTSNNSNKSLDTIVNTTITYDNEKSNQSPASHIHRNQSNTMSTNNQMKKTKHKRKSVHYKGQKRRKTRMQINYEDDGENN